MPINSRQKQMVKYINDNKRVSVKKLASVFFVSEMTVRRDLKELEQLGYILRYNGGAMRHEEDGELPLESRRLLHAEEKKRLSERARKHLTDNISVYVDSSSTCLYVVPILNDYKNITIITNSVMCLKLAAEYHIRCIMAGGVYYERDMCTVGSMTNDFFESINADVGFFATAAIADDGVISDHDEYQTAARRVMMKNCGKKIFLFEKSKLHKKYMYTLCTADDADDVILF